MRGVALSPRCWAASVVGLLAVSIITLPDQAMGQATATLFFPPGVTGTFLPGDPIPLTVRVDGAPFSTTKGTSQTDWLSLLYFTGQSGTVTATAGAITHTETQPVQCRSVGGTLLATPFLVVPVETLNLPLQEDSADVRKAGYNLAPGVYNVNARIPFTLVQNAINCDGIPGPVTNVGAGSTNVSFTAISNTLQVKVCCFTFVGFLPPVGPEVASPCSFPPSATSNFGNTIPFKFQLFLNNAVVNNAVALISAQRCDGQPLQVDLGQGSVPTNQFRFDPSGNQYVFNLATSVLPSAGTWLITVSINDGSKHQVLIGLK